MHYYSILLNKAENKEQSIQYLVLTPPENPNQTSYEPGVLLLHTLKLEIEEYEVVFHNRWIPIDKTAPKD